MPRPTVGFKAILGSRLFLIVTVSTGLAYLVYLKYLDLVTGSPMMATASYLVLLYVLIGISSVLVGLNVLSFQSKLLANQIALSKAASGTSSASMSLLASTISCFCHTSLLLPFLGSIAISGISVVTALVEYQSWTLAVFIAINIYLVYRALRTIQTPGRMV